MTDKERNLVKAIRNYFRPGQTHNDLEHYEFDIVDAADALLREQDSGNYPEPTVDRSLRGWVLVTEADGDELVLWANVSGLAIEKGITTDYPWTDAETEGWTVEPLTTGYSGGEPRDVMGWVVAGAKGIEYSAMTQPVSGDVIPYFRERECVWVQDDDDHGIKWYRSPHGERAPEDQITDWPYCRGCGGRIKMAPQTVDSSGSDNRLRRP